MNPRMRFGLSSCVPVGFEGGPVGFCSEELVLELGCCAAAARSASVAIFGAGDSGFGATATVSETGESAGNDASGLSVAPRASKATTTLFGDGYCGSSCPCDIALAGETDMVSALAQNIAKTASLDFLRCIYPRET